MSHKNNHPTMQKPKKNSKNNTSSAKPNYWLLAPIIFVISVLPFITRLSQINTNLSKFNWFTVNDKYVDFFLYYKRNFFLVAVSYMVIIIIFKALNNNKKLVYSHILIPLAVYAILSILSSVISEYRSYTLKGTHDHYESLFVLLGYCIIVYYIMLYIKNEKDIEVIINFFVVSVLVMSLLGLTQYLGKDFFTSNFGLKLITPKEHWPFLDQITFNFEKRRVYLTLHNPNYVGSYVALAAPLIFILALFIRNRFWRIPLYLLSFIGSLICLIGSKSKTGIISLLAGGILAVILFHRYILKYFYLTIPFIIFLIGSVYTYNNAKDNILVNQISTALNFEKYEPSLQDIQTLDDKIVVTYKNNKMNVYYIMDSNEPSFIATDENENPLTLVKNESKGSFIVQDERFSGFELGHGRYNETTCFYIKIDGHDWFFTNQTSDGTYYYITRYGKLDKINKAESSVLFNGYERYASNRGYIWSRTIPLLKKYLILGSGADTYVMAFPQQDYVNLYNFGYAEQILTKPHNLYLQIGVQTGVLSLIAYLVFYGMYFISSLKLYIKSKFNSYYSQVGVAILISTFSYMIVSIANDSLIAIAPIFWAFMGLGIVLNKLEKNRIKNEGTLK